MQFLAEYGLFFAKVLTIAVSIGVVMIMVVGGVAAATQRQRKSGEQNLEVTCLNKQYDEMERALSGALLSPQQFKKKMKADKKADQAAAKADKKAAKRGDKEATAGAQPSKRIYVLDFDGDLRASAVASLRQEISALLTLAKREDEVVVRLESPGGAVHGYGLAASQLQRIRERKIPLTICVDKVAASGGYLMACVANQIIAAPFAIIGSIGVLAQIPNLHRLLKKHDIDFEQLTAGKYKRTLTFFGENTEQARQKMRQELDEIHALFKHHVKTQRPNLDIEQVATGEHWLGRRALELGLVDRLQTSDDYLMAARQHAQLVLLRYTEKQSLLERITSLAQLQWWQPQPAHQRNGRAWLL